MNYGRAELDQAFGARFASFQLLGKGGEGAVFAVWDRVKKIDLALKISRDSGEPGHYERFSREYDILAAARSDRLVRVYEHGRATVRMPDGAAAPHFWYTMEKCDANVRQTYRTMSLTERLSVSLQMLDGLALLHAKTIAHRDIKPENLFLMAGTPAARSVKIGDFGISTVARAANAVAGSVYGSPAYLAPERWEQDADEDWRPADQYAAGVTMYELLSLGMAPLDFGTMTFEEAHRRSPVRGLVIPELKGRRFFAVDAVIKRMLGKVPHLRYPDMASCKRELEAALLQDGVTAGR